MRTGLAVRRERAQVLKARGEYLLGSPELTFYQGALQALAWVEDSAGQIAMRPSRFYYAPPKRKRAPTRRRGP